MRQAARLEFGGQEREGTRTGFGFGLSEKWVAGSGDEECSPGLGDVLGAGRWAACPPFSVLLSRDGSSFQMHI